MHFIVSGSLAEASALPCGHNGFILRAFFLCGALVCKAGSVLTIFIVKVTNLKVIFLVPCFHF